uniref:Uncharacterized protein n=1 Tax=Lepeophtheirus salmonis TaxID=72036 RepID=A0A0K2THR2_LEPSM
MDGRMCKGKDGWMTGKNIY